MEVNHGEHGVGGGVRSHQQKNGDVVKDRALRHCYN